MLRDGENSDGGAPEAESGRMRVRRVLIEPLIAGGMRRARAARAEDHEAMLRRLEERLAYLAAEHLEVLAEVVERSAAGPARNIWPDEVSIRNWAAQLAPPPDADSRLIVSWLGSVAGRKAWDEGAEVAVALRKHLRTHGRPPTDFDWTRIRSEADDWRRRLARVADRDERGTAGEADLVWRAGFERAAEHVRALVFAKGAGEA